MSDSVEITVCDNGPLLVSGGGFVVKDGKGNAFDLGGKDKAALCRCGHSGNHPFCDGKHKQCGFESSVSAG